MENICYIIKIGGSALTKKGLHPVIREGLLDGIVKNISKIKGGKIIIHGAGSFGHPIVKKHDLQFGFKKKDQLSAFSETKIQLATLNLAVVQCFKRHGIPSLSFPPSTFLIANNGRIFESNITPLKKILSTGLTPILHGDLVADLNQGFSVISGDQLVSYLGTRVPVDIAIFGCDVDGVYNGDPKKNKNVKIIRQITPNTLKKALPFIETSSAPDVTEGMAGKVKEAIQLAECGVKSAIINITKPENIDKLLRGEDFPYTQINPDEMNGDVNGRY